MHQKADKGVAVGFADIAHCRVKNQLEQAENDGPIRLAGFDAKHKSYLF
jgi:hypothetical protein